MISFGDPAQARVATLSLNPSWIEFESPSGAWLEGDQRRLASLRSLGAQSADELDDVMVERVVKESYSYFRGPNWYRSWFGWLESLLVGSGAGSYLDGTACHLDLVQWATKPAQRDVPPDVWRRLVGEDREFLRWQLANSDVSMLLLNGRTIVSWVVEASLIDDLEEQTLRYQSRRGDDSMKVFHGIAEGVRFVGWNKPVASAIPAAGRTALIEWVGERIRDATSCADPRHDGGEDDSRLDDGFVPAGTLVQDTDELERLLHRWLTASDRPTVGDVARFGGSPVVTVRVGRDEFVLNRDTKRAAVTAFLEAAQNAGGASKLRWHATANNRGAINRVSYLDGAERMPGWYAYLPQPSAAPRDLG